MIKEIEDYLRESEALADEFSAVIYEPAAARLDGMRTSLHDFLQASPDHQLVEEFKNRIDDAEKLLGETWGKTNLPQFDRIVRKKCKNLRLQVSGIQSKWYWYCMQGKG